MHWRIGSLQELEHFGKEARERVLQAAGVSYREGRMIINSAIIGALASSFLINIVLSELRVIASYWEGTSLLILWILLGAAAYQALMTRCRGQILFYLEKVAKSQRLPACLKCGYDLTGLTANRCPECGYPLAPIQSP